MQEDAEKIIAESRKQFTRPWEEVKEEIRKRQALARLPYKPGIFPLPEEEPKKQLPPAKPPL